MHNSIVLCLAITLLDLTYLTQPVPNTTSKKTHFVCNHFVLLVTHES